VSLLSDTRVFWTCVAADVRHDALNNVIFFWGSLLSSTGLFCGFLLIGIHAFLMCVAADVRHDALSNVIFFYGSLLSVI